MTVPQPRTAGCSTLRRTYPGRVRAKRAVAALAAYATLVNLENRLIERDTVSQLRSGRGEAMLRRMRFACLAAVALAIAGATSGAVAAGPAHGVQNRASVVVGVPTVGPTKRLALLRMSDL